MKTKRALYSIIVALSVFWLSVLFDFNTNSYKEITSPHEESPHIQADNNLQESDIENFEVYLNQYGVVASISDRLYPYKESNTNDQSRQNINGIDSSNNDISTKELAISDTYTSNVDTENIVVQDDTVPSIDFQSESLYESQAEQHEEPETSKSLYSNIGISIAGSYVNIREKASTDSNTLGKLYKNSAAKILDTVGDWYYIESGSVKGYIKSEFLKTEIPDQELVNSYGTLRISVETDGLNVREMPDTESQKLTTIYKNELYPATEVLDEWIKIEITDDEVSGYVNKEYIELLVDFDKAISKKEEEELIKLQEEEEEAERLKKIQEEEAERLEKLKEEERIKKETEVKHRDEVDYTEEELKLLACLVHSEAGDQSYEGKLAVANVVLNRMKSSKYPNTMKDVIYQPGQFSVAKSGSLKKQLANYDNYSSKSQKLTIKAAKAALSGENNIGDRMYFHAYKMAVQKGYDQKKNAVKLENHLFW